MVTTLKLKLAIRWFFENLSLEPCMDVLCLTPIQVNDSTVHYNTENKRKLHLCLTLFKHFLNAYSQVTFTWTARLSFLPKPLYTVQVNVPESFLLMFCIVSTFPSCTTVFPWFPGFSLVQVMFGSGWPKALQVKRKLLPSRTVGSPLIPVIFVGTKSNQTIISNLQGYLNGMYMYKQHAKVIILFMWCWNVLHKPCTYKENSHVIQEQSLDYNPL